MRSYRRNSSLTMRGHRSGEIILHLFSFSVSVGNDTGMDIIKNLRMAQTFLTIITQSSTVKIASLVNYGKFI